jgi:superfamily II DNA or RNA helicase
VTRAFIEVTLKPFQERLLEQIEISRDYGQHRNLLVSATGTGKTVMAGEDYRRLQVRIPVLAYYLWRTGKRSLRVVAILSGK